MESENTYRLDDQPKKQRTVEYTRQHGETV